MQNKMILGAALGALLVAGCASSPPSEPAPVAPSVAAQAGNNWTAQLEALKRALEESTRGSGVRIVQTADNHPSKPDPSMLEAAMRETLALPEHTVMIGDTAYDMEMARRLGVRAIGVGWGYHAPEELYAGGADEVADDPDHLEELLR